MRLLWIAAFVGTALPAVPALAPHAVSQKGKVFSVTTMTVKAGEPVTFTNDDNVAHNVFSASAGNAFNLKTQAPGASASHAFAKPGAVEVRCAFHPTMKLAVTVK